MKKEPTESELRLIIRKDSTASLIIDGVVVQEVGKCSGLDEARKIFNEFMRERGWLYRLESGFAEMWKEIMNPL